MFAGFLGAAKLQALMVLDQQPIQILMEIVPRHGGASPRGSIHPSRGPLGVATLLSVQMPKLSVGYPTRFTGVRNFWSGPSNVQGNIGSKARGGCFARAPVETALALVLGGLRRDGSGDDRVDLPTGHGAAREQFISQGAHDMLARSQQSGGLGDAETDERLDGFRRRADQRRQCALLRPLHQVEADPGAAPSGPELQPPSRPSRSSTSPTPECALELP